MQSREQLTWNHVQDLEVLPPCFRPVEGVVFHVVVDTSSKEGWLEMANVVEGEIKHTLVPMDYGHALVTLDGANYRRYSRAGRYMGD